MSWFWFYFVLHVLMLCLDAAWWAAAMRVTKRPLWRVLVSLFIGFQIVALLSLRCGVDWYRYAPNAILVGVLAWHFFAVAAAIVVLFVFGGQRLRAWAFRFKNGTKQTGNDVAADASGGRPLTRRAFIGACAALAPPLFTIGSTAATMAQLDRLRVRSFVLSIERLPRVLDGLTIAQVSDIHLGGLTSRRVLRKMVDMTNALRADLVIMTGDLINYELADLSEGLGLIREMQGRHGQWTIEGNHDLFENGGEFERRVRAANVPFLVNESAITNIHGHPIQFFGLGWTGGHGRQLDQALNFQVRELMTERHPDAFPILLAHHPHAFDAAVKSDLPLTLAGHTHGGFWMLDSRYGVGSLAFRYWSGHYARGGSHLVVSNGVGNWNSLPPVRVNAPAEIVHLTLRCGATRG